MKATQTLTYSPVKPAANETRQQSSGGAPAWWLMFLKEFNELWIGGKAPLLLFFFALFQSGLAYFMVSSAETTPPKEMVYMILQNAISVSVLIGLIIGADSISGERERATLESLLLTPASRRSIVFGKFLAGVSPWPAAFLITVPFMYAFSLGDEVFRMATLWGILMGTVMAPAFTALGMLLSAWSNSNKSSLFISLVLYLLFLIPTQLPGTAQTGFFGKFLQKWNPLEASGHFLENILVNNRGVIESSRWIMSPVAIALIVYGLLFLYASPGLGLEAEKSNKVWASLSRRLGWS